MVQCAKQAKELKSADAAVGFGATITSNAFIEALKNAMDKMQQ